MLDPKSKVAIYLAERYKVLLRKAKKLGIDLVPEGSPKEYQDAILSLHQNAISVEWEKRKERRLRRKKERKAKWQQQK